MLTFYISLLPKQKIEQKCKRNKIKNWYLSLSPFTQILNMNNPPKPSPPLPLKHHKIKDKKEKKNKKPQHRPPPSNHNNPQITYHHHYSINTSQTQKFQQNFQPTEPQTTTKIHTHCHCQTHRRITSHHCQSNTTTQD